MPDDNIEDLLDIVGTDEGMDHAMSQAQKIERQSIEPSEIDTLNIQVNSKVEELERGAGSEIKKLDNAKSNLNSMMETDQFEDDKESGLVEYGILKQALAVIEYYEDLLPRYIISKELSYNLKNELKAKFNQSKMVNDEARVEKMIDKSLEFNEKQLDRITSQFEKTLERQVDEVSGAAEALENLNDLESTAVTEIKELRKQRENQQQIQEEMVNALRQISSIIKAAQQSQAVSPGASSPGNGSVNRYPRGGREAAGNSSRSEEMTVRQELGEEFVDSGDQRLKQGEKSSREPAEVDKGSEGSSSGSDSEESVYSEDEGLPEWAEDEKDVKLKELYEKKHDSGRFRYSMLIDSSEEEYVEDLDRTNMWDRLDRLEDEGVIELLQ